MQDELAAAGNQQAQNAAQAQEVTRLQRQVADLRAEIATQAGIVRQSQQSRRELTQQHEAAQAGTLPHASSYQQVLQHVLLNNAFSVAAGITCMETHEIVFVQSESAWQVKWNPWQQENVL